MITTAQELLHEFESLPPEQKEVFARAIQGHLPPIASGELSDHEISQAGDELAAMLSEEEKRAARTR